MLIEKTENRGFACHPWLQGSGSGPRILVVEDHETNRRLASYLLGKLSCQGDCVCSGFDAIEIWREHRHDVIVMDCQMPGMDGLEATRRIRQHEAEEGDEWQGDRVRIVALTACAREEDRAACLAAGMDQFISKPFTVEQLARAIGIRAESP